MIRTAFVFSLSQIQFIAYDESKKLILHSISKQIPQETIIRGKIANFEIIELAIKQILAEINFIPQKTVLVIPEDTAISKSLDLPDMPIREIDEAVRYEAENFLPYPLNMVVLDWELISHNGENHVLFEAMSKKIIDEYLDIFEKLKIRILAIETPALSLVRLSEEKPGVRILIHMSKDEVILTLAKDRQVVATSIITVTLQSTQKIIQTVMKMMAYYKDFEVKSVQIGGMGVNTTMVNTLAKLKLPIKGYSIPFVVKPEIANNYLLAISACLKKEDLPESEETINLLPEWYVDRNQKIDQSSFWKKTLTFIFALMTIGFLGLSSIYFWLIKENEKLVNNQNQVSSVRKDALTETRTANELSKTVQKLAELDFFPEEINKLIVDKTVKEIKLAGVKQSVTDKKGSVTGMASDRKSLIAFKQALEDLDEISQVQLPASSITEEKDIPFQLQFILDKELVKKEGK